MTVPRLRDDIARWMTHMGLVSEDKADPADTFHIVTRDTGLVIEIFAPNAQPGVLVVGSKVIAKTSQTWRYLNLSDAEKGIFKKRVSEYAGVIGAVSRSMMEDGKLKVGVYVVFDEGADLNQQVLADAMDRVTEMYAKMSAFLRRMF